jgi:hypothetical protein
MGKVFVDNSPLPQLPSTRRQEEGAATVQYDQRVSKCWRNPQRWFGEVSTNFELVRYRCDECMHDPLFRF